MFETPGDSRPILTKENEGTEYWRWLKCAILMHTRLCLENPFGYLLINGKIILKHNKL